MKKPVLAALGVAGACAACCAVSLVPVWLSGASALGLATLVGDLSCASLVVVAAVGVLAAVAVVGGVAWWRSRREAAQMEACACGGAACAEGRLR